MRARESDVLTHCTCRDIPNNIFWEFFNFVETAYLWFLVSRDISHDYRWWLTNGCEASVMRPSCTSLGVR